MPTSKPVSTSEHIPTSECTPASMSAASHTETSAQTHAQTGAETHASEPYKRTDSCTSKHCLLKSFAFALSMCAIAVAAVVVSSFVFGLYGSVSSVTWEDFRNAKQVDTVILGSSYAQRGFDPLALDDELNVLTQTSTSSTINAATPGQCIQATFSTLKYAVEQKHVKRVIYGVGPEALSSAYSLRTDVPYLYARYENDPLQLAQKLVKEAFLPDNIYMKDSLNVFFPWVFIPARSPQLVAKNVIARLTNKPKYQAAEDTVFRWHYVGKGYGSYDVVLSPDDKTTSVSIYGMPSIDPLALRAFKEMLQYARAHNVEFICVATPHPLYDIASLGDEYDKVMSEIQKTTEAEGAVFIDANRVDPAKLCIPREGFHDFEHLNLEGAKIFSRYMASVIYRVDNARDVSADFLSREQWKKRLETDRF